jgi:anti-sigma factor RsiW
MTTSMCELFESCDVEMYFYGDLEPVDRARVELHLRGCAACRERLEDLHAIRRALASRPAVVAPPAGDWAGFMRRLDRATVSSSPRTSGYERPDVRVPRRWSPGRLAGLAAMLTLVAIGVLLAARFRAPAAPRVARETPAAVPAQQRTALDRALREGSAEHLERSKLVVLGLATRDPRALPDDWLYERTLAGTLLADTRLYRQAALHDGAGDVARVMRDLETVLLEASMSEKSDLEALKRVQQLIAKRDLVLKMQVVSESGRAGN